MRYKTKFLNNHGAGYRYFQDTSVVNPDYYTVA